MSKYKTLFIEESREHLSELNRVIVALEGSDETAPLVDDIFRHAHSIKGMAGSMGYDPIVAVAHRMEDVVGARRTTGEAFEPALIDLLLRAVDALAGQVESVANEAPIEEHTGLVDELSAAASPEPPPKGRRKKSARKKAAKRSTAANGTAAKGRAAKGPAATKPAVTGPGAEDATRTGPAATDSAATDSRQQRPRAAPDPRAETSGSGRTVTVRLEESCKTPGLRLFFVHKKLGEVGTVVDSTPSLHDMKRGDVSGTCAQFSVTSELEDAALREALLAVGEVEAVDLSRTEESVAAPVRVVEPAPEAGAPSTMVRVRTDVLDTLIDNVGELYILRERLEILLAQAADPELRTALDTLSAQIREVHSQVMTVRMTPMRTLTDRYPRLVRDLARSLAKDVDLEIEGAEIELDRALLDGLDEPLVHTLRNAVDHGIESKEERQQVGKPAVASVRIVASRDRDTVVVVVEDDGCGLDADLLRQRAVEIGLLTAQQAETLSARECYFLICAPAFSTKSEVTGLSGRGVGMDAVRAKIESLGGSLDIETEVGRSTRFIFRLPLTVAIINVLLVEAGGRLFAVPVSKVVAVRNAGEDTLQEAGGRTYVGFRHALAPVFPLGELLRLEGGSRIEHVVMIEDGRDLLAVAVERVVGYHEVVVKPLGDPLDSMEPFSGATILGEGEPILILDLLNAVRARAAA